LSRIRTRFRALAITSLAAVVILTALSAEATLATDPVTSPVPSADPSVAPTPAPSVDPSVAPTPAPSVDPSVAASPDPSVAPTADPSTPPVVADVASTAAVQPEVPVSAIVTAYARTHLRARYRHGSTGPRAFDCSGLMWRVFHEAGLGRKVTSTSARSIYVSYLRRGLASRHDPQVGDLVVWGRGSHVGLYVGRGFAISALTQGVRVHRVHAVRTPFTAYLHTGLGRVEAPVWRLLVATHIRSLRHTVRPVTLHTAAGSGSPLGSTLRARTRLVILSSARDGGRVWLRILTLHGVTGWLPASVVRR